MSISTGLDWTGNLGPNAESAAASVDKLVQSLRSLQSIQGKAGPTSAGLGDGGGIAGIGAAAKETNKAVLIQTKSAADLAKIDAQRMANLDVIAAKEKAAAGIASGQQGIVKERGSQAQALESARAASKVAAIQAQSDADRNRAIGRVIEGQAKAASAVSVEQAKGAQAAQRAAEKAALTEQQGAQKAALIREKAASNVAAVEAKKSAELAKIEAKRKVDIEKEAHKAATRASSKASKSVSEETTSGFGGAAKAILEGKGLKAALGAFGGKGAKIAAIGEVALSVGRAAFDAAKQVAGISYEFGKAVVGAQAFKEDIYEAFKTVRGTTAAADKTFQTAIQNADKLGITRAESIGQFLDLATKGFDDSKIKEIQGRLLDITTIDPRASIEGLTKVIGQVQATGRVNQETLNQLSTFGLEQGDVIRQIGKALNKSDAEVLKQLSTAGGLRDPHNIDFILNAIAGQTGGGQAGAKAAEKANRNLSSLLKRVSEVPQNILFDLNVGTGLDGIKSVLKSILDFFAAGSATAERASKVIGGAFNALVSGLTGKDISKSTDGITDAISFVIDFVEMSTPALEAFGSVVRYTAMGILAVTGGIGELIKVLSGDFSSITDFGSNASIIGQYFIDGLVGGISAGVDRVVAAVKSVTGSALTTAKSVLGIASPSKETHAFGEFYSIGLGDGIEAKTDYVTRSARILSEDALLAASMPVPQLGMGGASAQRGGASSGNVKTINVVLPPGPLVQVVAGPGTNVDELIELLDAPMRRLMIQIWQQIAQEAT